MRTMPTILAAVLAAASVAGGGAAWAASDEARQGDMGRGAQVWVNNCNRCHEYRDPKEFRDGLWRPIITHMRIRAGLTGQEARDVLRYMQESN
ncbi:cytochrome c [Inmirania thermothiophila]|uniref:Sulfite dehydrogenase (Cytochrome) subunit SorB n=1 Tax=Inmirania thermothiophila TaxID=1750597 RepID=A0A3N1YBL1_9GAMM|nr:cytochrome c [Inmirania thermothiophila]ROR34777.1 hypothetical protein EDC57_0681 [Inmirania thermothiophila]